jgi:hypothetical protein
LSSRLWTTHRPRAATAHAKNTFPLLMQLKH